MSSGPEAVGCAGGRPASAASVPLSASPSISAIAESSTRAITTAHPDVAEPLNTLMAKLTTEALTQLNGQVAVDRQKPEEVAQQWLSDNGLL